MVPTVAAATAAVVNVAQNVPGGAKTGILGALMLALGACVKPALKALACNEVKAAGDALEHIIDEQMTPENAASVALKWQAAVCAGIQEQGWLPGFIKAEATKAVQDEMKTLLVAVEQNGPGALKGLVETAEAKVCARINAL